MKRVIRNKKTRQFLAKDGRWTSDHTAAMVFANVKAVEAIYEAQSLKNVEEVLMVGDEPSARYDVIVPLPFELKPLRRN